MCNPVNTPRSKADVEKVLSKLAMPIAPPSDNAKTVRLEATVAAAKDGPAAISKSTVEAILPSAEVLKRFKKAKKKPTTAPADQDDDADEEKSGWRQVFADADDSGPIRAGRRKRQPA